MPLKHLVGVDHVVVAVRDLDAAAAAWKKLGFTLSPRGTHSAHMGSGNYTIVFTDDYMELLGVLAPTDHNRATVEFLAAREGIERVAFTTDDAAGGVAELQERGLAATGPVSFGRPVDLPNGGKSEAKFNVFHWPLSERPAGLRIFACQHLTPETVWIPELQTHANGAKKLVRVEILAKDPENAATHMAVLINQEVTITADGFEVKSGGTRASFLFYDASTFKTRYPDAVRNGAVSEGAVAIVIATDDLAKVSAIAGAVPHGGAVSIPAALATGAILNFVAQA
jgi:catechol 2,3-dioxygenase-like lactoylglutathione lyase family enzyme